MDAQILAGAALVLAVCCAIVLLWLDYTIFLVPLGLITAALARFLIRSLAPGVLTADGPTRPQHRLIAYILFGIAIGWIPIGNQFIDVRTYDGMVISLGVSLFFIAVGGSFLVADASADICDALRRLRRKK